MLMSVFPPTQIGFDEPDVWLGPGLSRAACLSWAGIGDGIVRPMKRRSQNPLRDLTWMEQPVQNMCGGCSPATQ
jgi:hypothetical protein